MSRGLWQTAKEILYCISSLSKPSIKIVKTTARAIDATKPNIAPLQAQLLNICKLLLSKNARIRPKMRKASSPSRKAMKNEASI